MIIINQPAHLTVHKKRVEEPYLTLFTNFESFLDFIVLMDEFQADIFRVSYNGTPILLPDLQYRVELYKKVDRKFVCIFSQSFVEEVFSNILYDHMTDLEPRDADEDTITHMVFEEYKLKIFLLDKESTIDESVWSEEGF